MDEKAQERQTYTGLPPEADVEEAPPASGEPAAPPAAEPQAPPQEPEPSPPPVSEPGMPPFHDHPRWKERQREIEALREQNQRLLEITQRAVQPPSVQPPPPADPWVGLTDHPDPATAQFWQTQRRLMEHHEQRAKQQALQEIQPLGNAVRAELARLNTKEFRKENPNIKPGSEEERLIIAYMNGQIDGVQHPLESAKRNALFDSLSEENQSLKSKRASTPQKLAAANSEASAGMPSTTGLPPRTGSWEETARGILKQGGSMLEVAQTIFGGPKRKP